MLVCPNWPHGNEHDHPTTANVLLDVIAVLVAARGRLPHVLFRTQLQVVARVVQGHEFETDWGIRREAPGRIRKGTGRLRLENVENACKSLKIRGIGVFVVLRRAAVSRPHEKVQTSRAKCVFSRFCYARNVMIAYRNY